MSPKSLISCWNSPIVSFIIFFRVQSIICLVHSFRSEFLTGYVTCILDDSRVYANHAKKKFIDLDDVRLAVKMQLERTFTNPPPRDVLLEVARAKNNVPLPFVKPNNGLRLPPDRYCLNSTNYRLKNATKKVVQKPAHPLTGNNPSGGQSRVKVEGNKAGLSIVKRPGTLATVARTQSISIPKPVLKFSTGIMNCLFILLLTCLFIEV